MTTIAKHTFEGGAKLYEPQDPDSLNQFGRDVAADLAMLAGLKPATVTSANAAAAAGANPTAAEFLVVVTLVNEIKTKLNAVAPATITSPSAVAAAGGTPTAAEFLKVVTLVNEIKTKLNANSATPLKTKAG